MAQVAVDLNNVTKHFGDFTAVHNLNLEIEDGEFFSLLGSSGCGKTTTLRMIAGLEIPTHGDIWIHGVEMAQKPAYQRPVNTVFQSYALFPHMDVSENIAFGLKLAKLGKSEIETRVKEALRMVRMETFAHRRPKQLSGGQQQRVALARALVNRPEVLLLDEPLGALDLKLKKEMQLELKKIQQEVGITFIYVTHDQEEALVMSDRIGVMEKGILLQVGTPTEMYERPVNRFVADFIGETNFIDGTLVNIAGDIGTVKVNDEMTLTARVRPTHVLEEPVTLSIRPEKILISDQPIANRPNHFPVTVENVAYVGSDTRIIARLPNGQTIDIWEANSLSTVDQEAYYAAGDKAHIAWMPSNALILKGE
jgi:spermidine/putrescine transport system ATP-binding protein